MLFAWHFHLLPFAFMLRRFRNSTLVAVVLFAGLVPSRSFAQLAITTTSPTPNLSSAARNSRVTVGFNQPPSSGAAAGLRVFSSQRGGLRTTGSGSVAVVGSQLVFSPTYDFKPGETVRMSVTTAVQSSGGALVSPRMFQFTAAATGGTGRFSNSLTSVGPNPYNVAMADVDNDGDLDMVSPDFGGASVSIRLNNGSGVFSGGSNPGVGSQPLSAHMADIDSDGDLDLLTANYNAASASVRFNNGSGMFSGGSDLPVGNQPQSVTTADIDGDGDLDMLVANGASNNVSVRINNGSGVFGGGSTVAVGAIPFNVTTGDIDNDGDLDMLTANWSSSSNVVSVRLNDGRGNFSNGIDGVVGISSRWISLADLDNDGDLDLLSANYVSSSASVRFNNGSGVFGGGTNLVAGNGPSCIVAADVDGDGDLDALMSDCCSNDIRLWLDNGSGTFSSGTTIISGANPNGIATADIDGDGDLDLLAANFSDNTISTLFNITPTPPAQVRIVGDSLLCNGGQTVLRATSPAPVLSYRWSTGATTQSITVTQPGNYTVTATFSGGGTSSDQHPVTAIVPSVQITGDSLLCTGQALNPTAAAPGTRSLRWSTGATTASISVSQTGTYSVTATYGTGCQSTRQRQVRAGLPAPVFLLGADTTACDGATVLLRAPAPPTGVRYRWSDGSAGNTLLVSRAGTYTLQVSTSCESRTVSRQVSYQSCLLIPNVVTANGDSYNDRFKVRGLTLGTWELRVYDRWGKMVFETTAYQNDWGDQAVAGVYFYQLRLPNGSASYKGWVEVLR